MRLKQLCGLFIAILVLSTSLVPGQTDSNKTVKVHFKPGTTSAVYSDVIRGYNTIDYALRANEGQRMSVKLKSKNTFLYLSVMDRESGSALTTDPPPSEVTDWEGTLPKTGDYFVRVYLVRAEARRKVNAPFSLTIEIK